MPPEERDAANLWDMLQSARDALEFGGGLTLEMLRTDRLSQHAVAKALENIGEAARRLSPEFRAGHAEVEWEPIVGMRHRLVHDYRNINFGIVWAVVQQEIPGLIEHLERWLPPTD